jgi:hypothetical protein
MKLEEYLDAVRNCPDELVTSTDGSQISLLSAEFGIYDNFPILLKVDAETMFSHLNSGNFNIFRRLVISNSNYWTANYIPGTVILQAWDCFISGWATWEQLSKPDHDRQMSEFDFSIMLHSNQEKKIPEVSEKRALAMVVYEIGDLALKNNIPLCLPKSRGWMHKNDYSRIVYFP